jgi:hypothetical protein
MTISAAEIYIMINYIMIDTIRAIDDVFIKMVEVDTSTALPLDEAVEVMWAALENGDLRLVVDGDRLRVNLFNGSQAERLLVAERQWPIVAARKRVLCCIV